MADYVLQGNPRDTVFLLMPQNAEAEKNLRDHAGPEAQFLGKGLAVEHRYVDDLCTLLQDEGWTVDW